MLGSLTTCTIMFQESYNWETSKPRKIFSYGPLAIHNPQQSDPDAVYEELPDEAQLNIELQENMAYRSVQ